MKAAKIKRYGDRITQCRGNERVFKELNGEVGTKNVLQDAKENKDSWNEI